MDNTDFIKRNNCRDLLNGSLNRMCITDDFNELDSLCFFAIRYINEYYDLNRKRLCDKYSKDASSDEMIL